MYDKERIIMKNRQKFFLISIVFYCVSANICLSCNNLFAKVLHVGGYHFPPFVIVEQDKVVGTTKKLIQEMNQLQDKYTFKFFLTSPKRRYYDFDKKKFDLILFEDINWGWKNKNIEASKVYLKGGEVYITKADPTKDQRYFDSFKDKQIAIIKGYHYGFANFNSDERFLKDNFNIQFSSYHQGNILKVIFERADIAVVNLCYLRQFFIQHPEQQNKILVSDKYDQRYNHTILLRKNISLTIEETNKLLTKMKKSGVLLRLWKNIYDN
jgi:ABC-type amino acid transport substrate-binding protein